MCATKAARKRWTKSACAPLEPPWWCSPFPSASTWTNSHASRTRPTRWKPTRTCATSIHAGACRWALIGSPTRDDVNAYADLRQELEGLCGAVNGDYGELDWMPVRYIHRMVARKRVPGLCRAAAVGLVTPLRDGMNLVAKEYVVAQDPDDPGVLVLSRFAGAAEQLKEALLVNPYDTQGMADSIQQALQMPLVERQARHQKLMARIRQHDVHWWRKAFLDALQAAG